MSTVELAWRNLGRNRRRTIITGAALVVGVALSVAGYGLTDGMSAELLRALTRNELGHVQIHQQGYPTSRALRDTIPHLAEVRARAARQPHLIAATPRVYAFGLIGSEHESVGVELVGVDPTTESKVTTVHEQLVAGRYLDAEPTPWPRGRELTEAERARDDAITRAEEDAAMAEIEGQAEDQIEGQAEGQIEGQAEDQIEGHSGGRSAGGPAEPDRGEAHDVTRELAEAMSPEPQRPPRVVIGKTLADLLNVHAGDLVHATAQTVDGVSEEVHLQVAGIFHTGTAQFDRGRVYMNLADLQRFTHLYDRAHELAILLSSPDLADDAAAALGAGMPDGVTVRSWSQIRPDVKKMLDLNTISMGVMIAIIFFVAALGVVNTMLMAVFERTRELGMLKAIGMSGRRIVSLVVTETLLLVVVFAGLGTAVGLALDAWMVHSGIDLSAVTSGVSIGGVGMRPVFHGAITVHGVVLPAVILAATCFLASFYPAVRAARLRPAVGMRAT